MNIGLPCTADQYDCSVNGSNMLRFYVSLHYEYRISLLSTSGNGCRQLIQANLPMFLGFGAMIVVH